MKWNVFGSVSEARAAISYVEDMGFEVSSTLKQTLRLTHKRQSDVLHAKVYCEGSIAEIGPGAYDTLRGGLKVLAPGEYDHSSGWTDYRLGELLNGPRRMCEVCTPHLLYGAMEGLMSFCRAVLDAESLSDERSTPDKKVLESAFHCIYTIRSGPVYCPPERAERALLSCREAALSIGDRYISKLIKTSSLRELKSAMPHVDPRSIKSLDEEIDQKEQHDALSLEYSPLLESLSEIVRKNMSLSAFIHIYKKPPRSISAVAVALSGSKLDILCAGGLTMTAPSVLADTIVSDDSRAVVLATTASAGAANVAELTNALSLLDGEMSDPINALRCAAGILGIDITVAP